MARSSSSSGKKKKSSSREGEEEDSDPEVAQRKRLKGLALSKNLVSEVSAKPRAPLQPSTTVVKHHGHDILNKSHRKNRFLFSFPGLLAPISIGAAGAAGAAAQIGDLIHLGTNNPVLYLHFPQGRMKLFGTIVFPKNRYLTMHFPSTSSSSRGGRKSVLCEDYFDNLIVFSDAWWIGTKEENPDEAQLHFPKELTEGQQADYDFKGGAGSTSANKQSDCKSETTYVEQLSPNIKVEEHLADDGNKDSVKATPVRHSVRTAGKRFNFGEASSGDDSIESDTHLGEGEDRKVDEFDSSSRKDASGKTENISFGDVDIDNKDSVTEAQIPKENQESSLSEARSKKQSQSVIAVTASKEDTHSNHGPFTQATISTFFKKVEKKKVESSMQSQEQLPPSQVHKTPKIPRKPAAPKVSGQKTHQTDSKKKANQDGGLRNKSNVVKERDAGNKSLGKKKYDAVEEEDIEEFSSNSQDTDASDEDWVA